MKDGLQQYNKNTADKRRPLVMTSPGHRQQKAKSESLAEPIIADLTARLEELTEELAKASTTDTEVFDGAKLYTEVADLKTQVAELKKLMLKEFKAIKSSISKSSESAEE